MLPPVRASISAVGSGRTLDPVALEFAHLLRERLGPRVRKIVLFGSRARGDARADSDYDDVVVVDGRSADVRDAILAIEVDLMDRFGSTTVRLPAPGRARVGGQPQNADRPERGSRGICSLTPEAAGLEAHASTFPREWTAILARLFEDRQTGDYDPTATLDMDEAARDVEDAGRIVEMVTAHLGR